MAQWWLRGHTTLSKHQSSVPSTHIAQLRNASNSSVSKSDALFWPPQVLHLRAHMHTYTQKYV